MKRIFIIVLFLMIGLTSKTYAFEQRVPFNVTQTTFTATTFSGTVTSTTVTYGVTINTNQTANFTICPATIGGTMILGASCLYCNNTTACMVDQAGSWLAIIDSSNQFKINLSVSGQ
jgi:hypothetical protein